MSSQPPTPQHDRFYMLDPIFCYFIACMYRVSLSPYSWGASCMPSPNQKI